MSKLIRIIILDIVLVLTYVLFIVICGLNNIYLVTYWYELLLLLVGVIIVINSTLVRSKIMAIIGTIMLIISIMTIL